ncbi:MAG: CGNR zinc finger domain-containing protein [Ilumatobacter sp.]|uniref:CGNR zinc finger domain-containing protein n=1 Tax=Ilumatobacter sp. TaxID=1967498 RepID=UPI00260937DA|nr:CGNR zinc finger domain-containing protein [Ilumatobacter sp.]MDJ0770827.1 CGNR zinc finger domain-containing protein [Ilumatobacter sp.]
MHVASVTDAEIRMTLEVMVDVANGLIEEDLDLRRVLSEAGFSRAPDASAASMRRAEQRMAQLLPFLRELGELDVATAATRINGELTELPITPSIVDHDDVGPHIHWTPSTATFDDQFIADVLMSLTHELCDNGTIRFGRCGADDCERLFYDATRNRSKRFCNDPRCASRTHTADHRARQRAR